MSEKPENYYIDKKEMYQELVYLNQTGIISEKLHLMFWTLAKNIARKGRFRGYSFKEDMITEGYMRCIKYAKSFKLEKFNPYSYFTTTIHNEFQNFIWDEKDAQVVKWKKHKTDIDQNPDQFEQPTGAIKDKIDSAHYSPKRQPKKKK